MKTHDHFLFYSEEITADRITLNDDEAHHANSVLRVESGDHIRVTDGTGSIFECEVDSLQKRSVGCTILSRTQSMRVKPRITVAVGIPDRAHFEEMLDLLTPLGVEEIVPVVMEHCRKPWWDGWEKSKIRLRSKMIVAMKQSLYPYIPQLMDPILLSDLLDGNLKEVLVADQDGTPLRERSDECGNLLCIIGPPGGYSQSELNMFSERKCRIVKIAPNRLRTELAATVFVSQLIGSCIT